MITNTFNPFVMFKILPSKTQKKTPVLFPSYQVHAEVNQIKKLMDEKIWKTKTKRKIKYSNSRYASKRLPAIHSGMPDLRERTDSIKNTQKFTWIRNSSKGKEKARYVSYFLLIVHLQLVSCWRAILLRWWDKNSLGHHSIYQSSSLTQ